MCLHLQLTLKVTSYSNMVYTVCFHLIIAFPIIACHSECQGCHTGVTLIMFESKIKLVPNVYMSCVHCCLW